MRRYLVVAHHTLTSRELVEAMRQRSDEQATAFHLLVPIHHGDRGLMWTEAHDRALARQRLDEAVARLRAEGLTVSGEVGGDSPVDSVTDVLLRDGAHTFAGILVSTLPRTVSKWLKIDAPNRIQRHTRLHVEHIVGHPADALSPS